MRRRAQGVGGSGGRVCDDVVHEDGDGIRGRAARCGRRESPGPGVEVAAGSVVASAMLPSRPVPADEDDGQNGAGDERDGSHNKGQAAHRVDP